MIEKLCNVALAVPLRTTFTYKIPDRLAAEIQIGSRVLVPFRKKSTIGVITEFIETPPEGTKLREIQKSLDVVPALHPKLLELGQWIASYYVAPIGEVYRAMLPPLTELHAQQRVVLTEAGRAALDATLSANSALESDFSLKSNPLTAVSLPAQVLPLLQKLKSAKSGLLLPAAIRSGIPLPDLLKLQRRALLEIRQDVQDRKRRMQRIIAWKDAPAAETLKPLLEKEQLLKNLLSIERGPL